MLVISTFLINSVFNFALGLLIARFLGPQGFGQYAIAASFAVVLNTLFLDWIRLAATRFYSDKTREENPAIRGTLDAIFILSSFGVVLTCSVTIALGFDFGLAIALAALVPAMSICNGLFDYHTALARARFEERSYSLMVILKNMLSLTLMVGGAWWFQSPVVVAAGFVVSVLATLVLARKRLLDPAVKIHAPEWKDAKRFFIYGFPVIVASMIYYVIPLWNRAAIANALGFAASGQFSLGYDIAIRVVQTVGSALDIILFQIALKLETNTGMDDAKRQVTANMGIVFAVIAAVATGYWLVLPSFEAVLVPEAFRGSFASVTTLLLPGLVCFALIQAAITPVFQLKQKTWPVVIAALVAFGVNAALTSTMGSWTMGKSATIYDYAQIQAYSYLAGFIVAMGLAVLMAKAFPKVRDVAGTCVATLAMIGAVWPLRSMTPGFITLLASALTGAVVFAAVAYAFNLAGCRTMAKQRRAQKSV
jgi:O-antigen/teichoic acid export membrane protein